MCLAVGKGPLMQVRLIGKGDDGIAHTDGNEGGDEARQLERVVKNVLADARSARSVEVDGSHFGGIVGDEKVAINSREHRQQGQRTDSETNAKGIKCGDGGRLREEHDGHEEQSHGKKEWILRNHGGNMRLKER